MNLKGELSMSVFRILAVALLLAFAASLPASSQQPHWLVGVWEGTISNLPASNRYGAERTLTVKSVSADGSSAQGNWVGAASNVNVTIAIAGETITFTSPGNAGATYKLTRKASALDGTWDPISGRGGGGVILKRK